MKIYIFSFACLFFLNFGKAQNHYRFHLLYSDGKLIETTLQKNLQIGDSLLADAKVKFEGKLAIFLDTLNGITRVLNLENNKNIQVQIKDLPQSQGSGPRCCTPSLAYLRFNKEKPHPIFNPKTLFSIHQSMYNSLKKSENKLGFTFTYYGKTYKRKLFLDDSTQKIELFKAIEYIRQITQDSLIKDFEIFSFSTYEKNAIEIIEIRDILIIESNTLKQQLAPAIQFFMRRYPNLDKETKELILDTLSLMIYELYGYPDEENLLIWLKENFQLDLSL